MNVFVTNHIAASKAIIEFLDLKGWIPLEFGSGVTGLQIEKAFVVYGTDSSNDGLPYPGEEEWVRTHLITRMKKLSHGEFEGLFIL